MNDEPDDDGGGPELPPHAGADTPAADRGVHDELAPPPPGAVPQPEPVIPLDPSGADAPSQGPPPQGAVGAYADHEQAAATGVGAGGRADSRQAVIASAVIVGVLVAALLAWAVTRDSGDDAAGNPAGTSAPAGAGTSLITTVAGTSSITTVAAPATTAPPAVVPSAVPPLSGPPLSLGPTTIPGIPGLPTFPIDSSTTPPAPTSVVPISAPAATPASVAVTTVPGAAVASTTVDGAVSSSVPAVPGAGAPAAIVVGSVVPDVAAFTRSLTPAQQREETLALAADGRHDIAVVGPVRTLCAVVALSGSIELAGRWERDGREVEAIGASQVAAPGLGDCLTDDDGAPLADGTYQFLVVDGDGNTSAPGTIVVGAARIEQSLVNDATAAICAVRVAPTAAGFYDAYRFDTAPIEPGATITLALGEVDQDVRVTSCGDEPETLATFEFTPDPSRPQPLSGSS